jgi:hypothetical protein
MKNGREVKTFLGKQKVEIWFNVWVDGGFVYPKPAVIHNLFRLKRNVVKSRLSNNTVVYSPDLLAASNHYQTNLSKIEANEANRRFTTRRSPGSNRRFAPREVKDFVTSLPSDFPRKKYRPRDREAEGNLHFGQRKLLLSEIQFLTTTLSTLNETIFGEEDVEEDVPFLVIYPGGGPGDHVPFLSQLFPLARFILIDPYFEPDPREPGKIKIVPDSKIIIRAQLFEDEYAALFREANVPIAFISDVRSTPPKELERQNRKQYELEFEKHAQFDMNLQRKWVDQLEPMASLLKFRLPFVPGTTNYLEGSLKFQAYAPKDSTEMRLSINSLNEMVSTDTDYDHTDIEEKLFYFNTVYRPSEFYDVSPLFGKNYDTMLEAFILTEYVEHVARQFETSEEIVFNLMWMIDRYFNREKITQLLL